MIGLWPEESEDQREEFLSKLRLLFIVILLISVLIIPHIITLIRVWGDMVLMIDNLQYTLPLLIMILKVFIVWYKKGALSPLIKMIVKDWMKVKLEEERSVMLKQARITRLVVICGIIIVLLTITVHMTMSLAQLFRQNLRHETNLTNLRKPLPMPVYYLHDVSSSPKYELTYLAQVIAILACGLSYTAVDNFLGLLMLHICGQLENLYLRVVNFEKDLNFITILKYNVEDHIRLIRSVEIIDNTFNFVLLGLLLFFGILFCLQGFLIITVVNGGSHLSVIQLIWYVCSSVSILIHMCLYCIVGELLVAQSEKIHLATYEHVWYTLEPKAARNLMLIMLRTKKPLNITAGKIFPMTMSTFCNLLKTSAGYVSVLLANRE